MTTLSLDHSTRTRRPAVPAIMVGLILFLTLLSVAHVAYNWTWVSATMPVGSALHNGVVVLYIAAAIYLVIAAIRSLGLLGEIEPRLTGGHLHGALLIGGGAALLTALLVTTSRTQLGVGQQVLIYGTVLAQFALIVLNLLYMQSATVKTALADSFGGLVGDTLLRFLARDAAVAILCMLASLIVVLAVSAMPSIKAFGLKFLVTSEWRPNELQVPRKDANGDPVIEDGEAVTDTVPPAFGALPVIYGTAVSSVISLAFAVPISLGAALFLVRIAPRIRMPHALQGTRAGNPSWIVNGVSFLVEFLAAIPSIAYGIWGLFVLAPLLQGHAEPAVKWLYRLLPPGSWVGSVWDTIVLIGGIGLAWIASRRAVRRSATATTFAVIVPLVVAIVALFLSGHVAALINSGLPAIEHGMRSMLGNPPNLSWMFEEPITVGGQLIVRPLPLTGRDMLCGGMVLAIMILPIITAISRDVLRSVPRHQVEGTVALGATWWQTSWEMLRYSRSGLFGAVMLGLARAAGETMAITMVIGNNNQIRASVFAPAQTMSSLLANEFHEASTEMHRSALTEVALVLLVMSLVFNVVARYLVVGKQQRVSG